MTRRTSKSFARTFVVVLVLCASCAVAQAIKYQPVLEKVPDVESTKCSNEELVHIVHSPSTASLLGNFDLDTRKGIWLCTLLKSQLLSHGNVFLMRRISAQVDDGDSIALLSLRSEPRMWVIPISSGMLEYPNVPNDSHNRAAFNALLAENGLRARSPETWTSLAILYLNMTGNEVHVRDWKAHGQTIQGLISSPVFFRKKSLHPEVTCEGDECNVTISDTQATSVTQKVTIWELTFSMKKGQAARLDDVQREEKPLSELP